MSYSLFAQDLLLRFYNKRRAAYPTVISITGVTFPLSPAEVFFTTSYLLFG